MIVVTEQRLLARSPGDTAWKSWSFRAGLRLTHHDHAGVGHMELFDDHGRLASWRFTLGQNLHAIRVLEQFVERLDSHLTGQPVLQAEQEVCPSCKAPLEPEQEECPICAKVLYTP
ncbi:MAG: ABC transporter, partial [Janthinobacterium lividum]|nr:ABC transporter [Janthinobacterium lividum]